MFKQTIQRKLILKVIDDLGHTSVKDIIETIKENYPEIGVATIYRNIASLEKEGYIRRISTNLEEVVYETTELDNHDHFICLDCGMILDIPKDEATVPQTTAEGDLIIYSTSTYYGVCKDCLNSKKS